MGSTWGASSVARGGGRDSNYEKDHGTHILPQYRRFHAREAPSPRPYREAESLVITTQDIRWSEFFTHEADIRAAKQIAHRAMMSPFEADKSKLSSTEADSTSFPSVAHDIQR
jgi:hypothetical protein